MARALRTPTRATTWPWVRGAVALLGRLGFTPDTTARLVVVAVGYLFGGPLGAIVAIAGLIALEVERPGAVAGAAVGALVGAALATVLEQSPSGPVGTDFATDRPVAAGLAQAAAILAFIAIGVSARSERAPKPVAVERRSWRDLSIQRVHVAQAIAIAFVGTVTWLVRLGAAPPGLPPGYGDVVGGLRSGDGFVSAMHPPLAAVLAAFAPVSPRMVAMLATSATVVVVGLLGLRVGGRAMGLTAALLAAVVPSVWGQQLPEALAALGVAAALAWGFPSRVTPARALLAGLSVGLATLARPEALSLVPVLVAWLFVDRQPSARNRAGTWMLAPLAALVIAGFLVGYVPWARWVEQERGTLLPSTNLGATLAGANTARTQRGSAIGAWDVGGVVNQPLRDNLDEAEQDKALRSLAWQRADKNRALAIGAARILRGWELWSPENARTVRATRGLPLPGRTVGAVGEMLVSVLALATLIARRRDWRLLLPFMVLPLLFCVESAVLFGDRGLRAWVMPAVVLLAALPLSSVRSEARP